MSTYYKSKRIPQLDINHASYDFEVKLGGYPTAVADEVDE
jgi:hypothetical protein